MLSAVTRRPIVPFTLAWLLGTALGLEVPAGDWTPWLGGAGVLGLGGALLLAVRAGRAGTSARGGGAVLRFTLTQAGGVLLAWWVCVVHPFSPLRNAAWPFPPPVGERLQLRGLVADDPDAAQSRSPLQGVVYFTLRADGLRRQGREPWQPARAVARVRWHGGLAAAPVYGEQWTLTGRFQPDRPGRGRGTGARPPLFVTGQGGSARLATGGGSRLLGRIYEARRQAAALLGAGLERHPTERGVLQALVLGYRTCLSYRIRDAFVASGTLHIFAVSGLHVCMIAAFFIILLQAAGIPRVRWVLFLAPLLTLYTLGTGLAPSAARACVMSVVFFVAPVVDRRANTLCALALAALLILLAAPGSLRDLGFIFSFAAVLGIVLLYRPIMGLMGDRLKPDPLRLQPERWPTRLARLVAESVWSTLAVSCAAWLATTPVSAWYFGRFTPVALLSNLAVVPLSFVVLLSGCLSLVFGACFTAIASIFNHASLVLIKLMVGITIWTARLPGGNIVMPSPPLVSVLAWYALLALLLLLWHRRRARAGESDDARTANVAFGVRGER